MNYRPHLLLASNSPRRRQLLALGIWPFSTSVADVDESRGSGEDPSNYVLRLAEAKARAASKSAGPDRIIVGADTAVVDGMDILGKPKDPAEAAGMLRRLRAHSHQVYTALAVLRLRDGTLLTDLCVTDVPMRSYTDDQIESYVLTGDPLDKAGAYAIQHPGFNPVENMQGCYASVMGLPLCHLVRTLRKLDILPGADVASACQAYLQYQCPVSDAILRGEQVG
ncbi:MAG: septum formation protein Maf [Chloroflexi bacterium RBG_16_56_8]|nr:MAG: septum formation protein Maf [Chloroflexi bacterium RBG_16_56_8]